MKLAKFILFVLASTGIGMPDPVALAKSEKPDVTSGAVSLFTGYVSFTDLKYYDKLYGDSLPLVFGLRSDWHLLKYPAFSLGLRGEVSYMTRTGHSAKRPAIDDPPEDLIEISDQETELTIIPYKLLVNSNIFIWQRRFVLNVFAGYGEEYYVESHKVEDLAEGKSLYASGFTGSLVFGAGMDFKLDWLDPRAIASMRRTMGLKNIFLSVFFEQTLPFGETTLVTRKTALGVNLGRSTIGLGFTFTTT